MGFFSSSKPPPKPSKQPDVVRMVTGRATYEEAAIEHVLKEQQAQQLNALESERRAVNEVAERERQMLAHLATIQAQLAESNEELERSRKAEEDLHKALRLAAACGLAGRFVLEALAFHSRLPGLPVSWHWCQEKGPPGN